MPVGSTMGLRRAGQTAVVPESDDAAATGPVPIGGHVAPGYEPVRDAFAANFAERGEVGAAVCVRVRGEVVVDLWGGWADEARTRPWCEDTLVNVYSVGKAVAAALVLTEAADANGVVAAADLADFKRPRELFVVSNLARTASGKLDRRAQRKSCTAQTSPPAVT